MNRIWLFVFLVLVSFSTSVRGQQSITLEECLRLAKETSPLQKKKLYLESVNSLSRESYATGNYPMLGFTAQASYQTDVFRLPFVVPGIDTPIIPKDQYRVYIDFYQNLYDGGSTKKNQAIADAEYAIGLQEIEISMQQVEEIVNKLYFSILLLQENTKLIGATHEELREQKALIDSQVEEGAALPGASTAIEREMVVLDQSQVEIQFQLEANKNVLARWIETEINDEAQFQLPGVALAGAETTLSRPELKQFDNQISLIEMQKGLIDSNRIPDIGIYGFGGYGYPNPLNWFDVQFAPHLLAGIRLSWHILDYGTAKRTREIYSVRQQSVLAERENFQKAVEANLAAARQDIAKYEALLAQDDQIIRLQEELVSQSEQQLQNGVIPPAVYISEVQELLRARLTKGIHKIKYEESKVNYLTELGTNSGEL